MINDMYIAARNRGRRVDRACLIVHHLYPRTPSKRLHLTELDGTLQPPWVETQ